MERLACFVAVVFCVVGCNYSNSVTRFDLSDFSDLGGEQSLEKVIPKLPNIARNNPNSLETQLAIAFLYEKYGTPSNLTWPTSYERHLESEAKLQEQFERVFAIDPNNKVFWAVKSKQQCGIVSARFFYCLGELRRLKERKLLPYTLIKERDITLFDWLRREDNVEKVVISESKLFRRVSRDSDKKMVTTEKIVIKDIESAAKLIRWTYSKNKMPSVMKVINQGQSIDPNNSLYNYLRAHLYLVAGENEKAIREIEEGVKKQVLLTYDSELREIASKVIKLAGASRSDIKEVTGTRTPFEGFLGRGIWSQGLSDLAQKYEKQGDYDKAENIYKLTIRISWQAEAENIYPKLGGLDTMAFDRLMQLRKKRFKRFVDEPKKE